MFAMLLFPSIFIRFPTVLDSLSAFASIRGGGPVASNLRSALMQEVKALQLLSR
jgi:hypothetical protein